MSRHFGIAVTALTLLWGVPLVHGQKATEIFIPIGQSPGLSGKVTHIGKITAVDVANQTITMADSAGTYTIKITDRTDIWLDKSKLKATNQRGQFADLRKDLRVEIKYENNQRQGPAIAEWIKVEILAQEP